MNNNFIIIANSYYFKNKNRLILLKNKKKKKYRILYRLNIIKSLFIFKIYRYRRSFLLKLKNYRKYIQQLKYIVYKKKNNLFIYSHFIYLGGFSYTLLKDFFVKELNDFDNVFLNNFFFEPIKLTKVMQKSIYLYKKKNFILKNKILLSVNKKFTLLEKFHTLKFLLNLTIIPYNLIPVSFLSDNFNSLFFLSIYLQFYNFEEIIKNNLSLLNIYFILQLKLFLVIYISFFIYLYKKLFRLFL